MGQGNSDNSAHGGAAQDLEDEDLKEESRLPGYFYEAVKALYKNRKDSKLGLTVKVFIDLFKGKLDLSKDLENFLVSLFKAFDRDNNKYLSFREAITLLDTFLCGETRERITGIFRMCDRNKDNVIDEDELTDFMQTLSCLSEDGETTKERRDWLRQLAGHIFDTYDTDGDGQLTKVEFMEGCLRDSQMLKEIEYVMGVCVGYGF